MVAPYGRWSSVLLICALGVTHGEPAVAAEPLSLERAVDTLKRENLALLAGRFRLSRARAEVVASGVWTNPNLSVNGLFGTHGATTGGRYEITMAIDQVIPLFGQVALRKDVARTLENAEERAYAALVWDTLADAKLAYVELQRTQARLRAVRVGLSEIEKIETIVSERAAAGANAVYDRLRVSVERGKWDARVVDAAANLANAQVALAEAISPTIDARNLTVPEAMNKVPLMTRAVEDVDALVRAAMAHRPDLESARLRVAANDASVSLQRRQVLPSPDVSVGYARLFDVPNSPVSGGGAFLAGVSIPLPLLDRGQGSIERARATADEERARHDKMLVSVRRDIERAARTATMTRENWHRFQQTTAEQVQRLRAIAEFAYREGRATILELLDAHAAHVDAEERRIELEARAVKATLELERATGPQPGRR